MGLVSGGRSLERIVAFGPEGVGKSELAKEIASKIDGILFVIDNDNAWDRMLEGVTVDEYEVASLHEWRWDGSRYVSDDQWCRADGNIVIFHTDDGGWLANIAAIAEVRKVARRDDWCCIDSGTAPWDDVQAWFTDTVFNSDLADYFLQVRLKKAQAEKDAKALGALDGWVDWPVINAAYKQHVMKFLVNPPCHLIVTAEQAEVTKEDTDKDTRTLYGADVKAKGQKRLGHNVQTVLRLRREANGDHVVWTLKDRGGREKLTRHVITDRGFSDWYLTDVAGWGNTEDEAEDEVSAEVPATKGTIKAKG